MKEQNEKQQRLVQFDEIDSEELNGMGSYALGAGTVVVIVGGYAILT